MGGQNEIRIYSPSEAEAKNIADQAIREILRIENAYSRYLPNSLISQINLHAGKEALKLDSEAVHLFQVADHWFRTSNGLFDITSGVMRSIWNAQINSLPGQQEINAILKKVGWEKVLFVNNEIGLPSEGMELDLGGIAKEYAVDRAAQILDEQGIKNGLINLGGDIRILGPHLDGSPWPVQIAHPRMTGQILATINIAKGSLATSGDYIRFRDIAGKRYGHILNPKTGQPVSYWQSATVLAPLCLLAGHASTLTMLLEDRAKALLEQMKLQFLLVGPSGEIIQNLE